MSCVYEEHGLLARSFPCFLSCFLVSLLASFLASLVARTFAYLGGDAARRDAAQIEAVLELRLVDVVAHRCRVLAAHVEVAQPARHPGADVAPRVADHHHHAVGHVLAAVVARAGVT